MFAVTASMSHFVNGPRWRFSPRYLVYSWDIAVYIINCYYYYCYNLGDPGVDGRIILRWIFRKWGVGVWTGSSWLRIGTGGGHL
jgi:hypothetical protein